MIVVILQAVVKGNWDDPRRPPYGYVACTAIFTLMYAGIECWDVRCVLQMEYLEVRESG